MKLLTQTTLTNFEKTKSAPDGKLDQKYCNITLPVFGYCNDITVTDHFNPCPISPRPFVYALSSHLREEGRIMQRNNGAPLCQLAPIIRTYRLCQNSLAPTVPLCLWPERGSFIQEASKQRHSPLNCAKRNKAGGGWGVFVVCSLMATWNFFWRKPVFGMGGGGALFRSERGTKRRHTPPQKPQWWPAAAGSDYKRQGVTGPKQEATGCM